jgi:mono/diheme cytochrome c family protein
MFKSSLLLLAAVFVAVLASVQGGSQQKGTPAPAMQPTQAITPSAATQAKNPVKQLSPELQAKAKSLYQIDCALCHGDTGNGKTDLATSMNLTLDDWTNPASLANKTDADLFTAIRNGKGEKMPPEDAARAKDTEVWSLILYIRNFSKGHAATPVAPVATPDATPSAPAAAPAENPAATSSTPAAPTSVTATPQ